MVKGILTDEETKVVIKAFLEGNGPSTEGQIVKAVRWAEMARVDGSLLGLVMDGRATMKLNKNGNVIFKTKESHQ